MRYELSTDWMLITEQFQSMFAELGDVTVSEDRLSYASVQPAVATALALTSSGELLANMPLHSINSRFEHVEFHKSPLSLTLSGANLSYTYTVPSAIVLLRASD